MNLTHARRATVGIGASGLMLALPAPVGAQSSPAPSNTETATEVIRAAMRSRGVSASNQEVLDLARQLGSAQAARELFSSSPAQLDARTRTTVTVGTLQKSASRAALAGNCSERADRYSTVVNVELMYHVMRSTWCWDSGGNVTSVSAYRSSYGTTLAGQLAGYRWTAEPTVQEQAPYLASTYTDKYGRHDYYKGRSRLSGHWAICLSGPWDWFCPVEKDGHTVTDLGYGSASTSMSYNS